MAALQFFLGLFFLGGVLSSFKTINIAEKQSIHISKTDDLMNFNQITNGLRSSLLMSSTNKSTTTLPKTTTALEPPSSSPCNGTLFLGIGDHDYPNLIDFKSNATGTSARWVTWERDWFCLELKGNLTGSSYMALGFSQGGMGPA